jgi:hypothetical protein
MVSAMFLLAHARPVPITVRAQTVSLVSCNFCAIFKERRQSCRILECGAIGAHWDTIPDNMTVTYDPNGATLTQN